MIEIFENVDCFSKQGIQSIQSRIHQKIGCWILDIPYNITENHWESQFDLIQLRQLLIENSNENTPMIFFTKQPFTTKIMTIFEDLFRFEIIWMKEKGTNCYNANINPLSSHENILICSIKKNQYFPLKIEKGKEYIKDKEKDMQGTNYNKDIRDIITTTNKGERTPISVVYCPRDFANCGIHPTQKPVWLLNWLLQQYSKPTDIICDITCGSASTLIACLQLQRSYIGFELDSNMFQLAQKRIKEFKYAGKDRFKKPKVNKDPLQTNFSQYFIKK